MYVIQYFECVQSGLPLKVQDGWLQGVLATSLLGKALYSCVMVTSVFLQGAYLIDYNNDISCIEYLLFSKHFLSYKIFPISIHLNNNRLL